MLRNTVGESVGDSSLSSVFTYSIVKPQSGDRKSARSHDCRHTVRRSWTDSSDWHAGVPRRFSGVFAPLPPPTVHRPFREPLPAEIERTVRVRIQQSIGFDGTVTINTCGVSMAKKCKIRHRPKESRHVVNKIRFRTI